MKIRISYTVEIDDEFRRAIAFRLGDERKATIEQVRAWFEDNGRSCDDDLLSEYRERSLEGRTKRRWQKLELTRP